MHRLLVQLKEPLNAPFCEAVVTLFGECELTPISENYCVVEGLKLSCDILCFDELIHFLEQYTLKAYLSRVQIELDSLLHQLQQCPKNAFLSDFELPEILFYEISKINNSTWLISSLYCDDFTLNY